MDTGSSESCRRICGWYSNQTLQELIKASKAQRVTAHIIFSSNGTRRHITHVSDKNCIQPEQISSFGFAARDFFTKFLNQRWPLTEKPNGCN